MEDRDLFAAAMRGIHVYKVAVTQRSHAHSTMAAAAWAAAAVAAGGRAGSRRGLSSSRAQRTSAQILAEPGIFWLSVWLVFVRNMCCFMFLCCDNYPVCGRVLLDCAKSKFIVCGGVDVIELIVRFGKAVNDKKLIVHVPG